jgi:hypothetical protein
MIHQQSVETSPYEFSEYPKMVYPDSADGKPKYNGRGQAELGIIVNDEAEEAEVMKTKAAPVREGDEKARLLKVCAVKGVPFDKRWGVEKLTTAIEDAGFDASLDPDA